MIHHASPNYGAYYRRLPSAVQKTADKLFAILDVDARHPSLHFKKVGRFWSVRVGLHHRAIGVDAPDGVLWIWIGTHADYDGLVR